MKVAVAFDHRGVKLRERVLEELAALGHEVVDLGTDDASQRIDYPDKARELGEAIQDGDAERGVLVCGSGVGASVAACSILRKRFRVISACVALSYRGRPAWLCSRPVATYWPPSVPGIATGETPLSVYS